MPTFQIAYQASTKHVVVQTKGDVLPANHVKIGEFEHEANNDPLGKPVPDNGRLDDNHVIWHHVRDALYKQGQENMQVVSIDWDKEYIALTSFTVVPATVSRTVGQTQQITNVFTPANATNKAITYVSSDPTKATVNSSGLITAVAIGSATITATAADGGSSHTCVVTVT